jgi:4-amino-4-deoxy-L-arabinose transferase-like glycosyltransferase
MHFASSEYRWFWRFAAALLIGVASFLHVYYLVNDCPLDLAPDEAQYWDWSRHLDWSYYSKGPVVALLIRASCELFGPWAEAATGSIMPAIRFPAVLCGALLLASLYVLTALTLRREDWAFGVVALALTQPVVAAGSSLMTIDAPYTACWGWALVFAFLAAVLGQGWAWPVTGLIVAVGILSKYTMVLFVPSVALFLFFQRFTKSQSEIRQPQWKGFWIMSAIAALGAVPILVWNFQHDWVTFRHVGWQAGATERTVWRWFGPFTFVAGQFGLLLGFWFVVWAAAMWNYRPREVVRLWGGEVVEASGEFSIARLQHLQFLWWLSVPMFAVFLFLSMKTTGQMNWAVTAYLSGGVLAAAWLGERASRRGWQIATATAGVVGLLAILVLHFPALSRPVLVSIVGRPSTKHPMPLRRIDPTARLRGYRTLAEAVDRVCEQVRAQGQEPIIAATFWNVPGILGVYCDGHPQVYTLGPALYDRRSQLDFWRPNPLWDPEEFRGRTFVLVGDFTPRLLAAFDSVKPPLQVRYEETGQPIAQWYIGIGEGYRGFGSAAALLQNKRY